MSLSYFSSFNGRQCSHCSQTDFKNAKLKNLLGWLLSYIFEANRNFYYEILRENCVLESWWADNKKSYDVEQKQKAEQEKKQQSIRQALSKLTDDEKRLLKIPSEVQVNLE